MSFCGFCGGNIPDGGVFCGQCGRKADEPFVASASAPSSADTAPITTVVPIIASSPPAAYTAAPYTDSPYTTASYTAPYTPPYEPPPTQALPPPQGGRGGLMAALAILGVCAVGGGIYLVTKSDDSPTTTAGSTIAGATTIADGGTPIDNGGTTASTVFVDPEPAAAEQLQQWVAQDRPTADTLVGKWIPQLSAKRVGLEADGIVYGPVDIVADHEPLRATYGAILVDGGAFQFTTSGGPMTGWFLSIVPEPFDSKAEALDWCTDRGLNSNNCLAREFKPPNP